MLEYPYEPPEVVLLTRIYHLNFIMHLDGTSPVDWLVQLWNPGTRKKTIFDLRMWIELYFRSALSSSCFEYHFILANVTYVRNNDSKKQ
jgi:hypothetical protein